MTSAWDITYQCHQQPPMVDLVTKGEPREAHPEYWAPFVLVSYGRQKPNLNVSNGTNSPFHAAGGTIRSRDRCRRLGSGPGRLHMSSHLSGLVTR